MTQFRTRNRALLVVGALVLAGCASQQEPEPVAQEESPVDVAPVESQAVQAEPTPSDFDNRSRPLTPSGRILATKFYFHCLLLFHLRVLLAPAVLSLILATQPNLFLGNSSTSCLLLPAPV